MRRLKTSFTTNNLNCGELKFFCIKIKKKTVKKKKITL